MFINNVKQNLKSGLTVSLISIPLSVSLAVASNVSPLIGIITGIWAGLIAGIFGGSHYNIVGPTGALSGVIATYVLLHGLGSLPTLTVLVGILILIAYMLRLERYLILIPSGVIHGFTLGVAFIIALNQLNSALGLQNLAVHEHFFENVVESLRHVSSTSLSTVGIFLLFLIGLFIFKKITPKLPGAIILAPVGIILGYLSTQQIIPLALQTLGSKFSDFSFRLFQPMHWEFSSDMVQVAAVIALIAILETMLSAKIADAMTHTKHQQRKEMFGLGLANIVSGLVGGMPATAALARTSLNIKTGATHRSSAILNTIFMAVISLLLLGYFSYIPMAVIASILVFVAAQMVELKHFIKFWYFEKSSFVVAIVVAVVTIVEDPIIGILLGATISLLLFVNRLSHGHFDLKLNKFDEGIVGSVVDEKVKEIKENADVVLYSIRGKLCYINSRAHVARFESELHKYKYVILRLREVYFIDLDGIEALDEIINLSEARGQQVLLTSVDPGVLSLLEQSSSGYKRLRTQNLVFEKTQYALQFLNIPVRTDQQ